MKCTNTILLLLLSGWMALLNGQSVMELKERRAEVDASRAEAQAEVDQFQGEIDAIDKQLEILGGWKTEGSSSCFFDIFYYYSLEILAVAFVLQDCVSLLPLPRIETCSILRHLARVKRGGAAGLCSWWGQTKTKP